jgi:hypothetical protein
MARDRAQAVRARADAGATMERVHVHPLERSPVRQREPGIGHHLLQRIVEPRQPEPVPDEMHRPQRARGQKALEPACVGNRDRGRWPRAGLPQVVHEII